MKKLIKKIIKKLIPIIVNNEKINRNNKHINRHYLLLLEPQ